MRFKLPRQVIQRQQTSPDANTGKLSDTPGKGSGASAGSVGGIGTRTKTPTFMDMFSRTFNQLGDVVVGNLMSSVEALTAANAIGENIKANFIGQGLSEFEAFERQIRDFTVSVGLLDSEFESSKESFMDARFMAARYGMELKDLVSIQAAFTDAISRKELLSKQDLERFVILRQSLGLSNEELKTFISTSADLGDVGLNLEDTFDLAGAAVKESIKFGVNAKNVLTSFNKNANQIKNLRFQNGTKDLIKMAAEAEKFRFNIEETFKVAEKNRELDNVLETTAELATLGVNIDPFSFMYKARNDAAGLQEDILKMTDNMVTLNNKTGEFEFLPGQRDIAKRMAETLGMSFDSMKQTMFRQRKLSLIDQMIPEGELKDKLEGPLADAARIGRGGEMEFSIGGDLFNIDEIMADKELQEKLEKQAQQQRENIASSEKDILIKQLNTSQTMVESLSGIFGQVKALAQGPIGAYRFAAGDVINREDIAGANAADMNTSITKNMQEFDSNMKDITDKLLGGDVKEGMMMLTTQGKEMYSDIERFVGKFRDMDLNNPTPISSAAMNVQPITNEEYDKRLKQETSEVIELIKTLSNNANKSEEAAEENRQEFIRKLQEIDVKNWALKSVVNVFLDNDKLIDVVERQSAEVYGGEPTD